MRFFKLVVAITILIVGLISCDDVDVTFTHPQPEGDFQKTKFKGKFTGTYLCVRDSSVLTISKRGISQNWSFVVEVDSNQSINDATRNFSINTDESDLSIIASEDSTKFDVSYTHQLFEFTDGRVLKYVGGVYFLNYPYGSTSWEVKTMRFDEEGFLIINELDMSVSDVAQLKTMTEILSDTNDAGIVLDYYIEPTRKEFNQIMDADIFATGEKFVKIKR